MSTSFIGQQDLPIGLRNNNPGDIKTGIAWQGMIGSEGPFITFESVEWGLRALATDLGNKIKEGYNTVSLIVNRYAPASDRNDVPAYINAVTEELGVGPNDLLSADSETLHSLMRAVIDHELGGNYAAMVTDDQIDTGISMVGGSIASWIKAAGIATENLLSTGNTSGSDTEGGSAPGGVSIWAIIGGLVIILGGFYFVNKSRK